MDTFCIRHRPVKYTTPRTRSAIVVAVFAAALSLFLFALFGCATDQVIAESVCRARVMYCIDVLHDLRPDLPLRVGVGPSVRTVKTTDPVSGHTRVTQYPIGGRHVQAQAFIDGEWVPVDIGYDGSVVRVPGDHWFKLDQWIYGRGEYVKQYNNWVARHRRSKGF